MRRLLTPILLLLALLVCLPAARATDISGTIAADTTLNLAGSPWRVVSGMSVNPGVTLTVNPGVVVQFNNGTYLQVYGHLQAVGNSGSRITFTGATASPGWWVGIRIEDGGSATMDYTDTAYGGYSYWGDDPNIRKTGGGSLLLNHSTVSNSVHEGIWILDSSANHTIQNSTINNNRTGISLGNTSGTVTVSSNTIQNNLSQGVQTGGTSGTVALSSNIITGNAWGIYLPGSSALTLNGDTLSGNTNGPAVTNGTMTSNTTWPAGLGTLVVSGNFAVNPGTTLTIEPGLSVKFQEGNYLNVSGHLQAVGSAVARIGFSGTTTSPGWWVGIRIEDGGSATMDYTDTADAGYSYWGDDPAIRKIGGGSLDLNHSTVSTCSREGIWIQDSAANHAIRNSTIEATRTGLYLTNLSGTVTVSTNTIRNNSGQGIQIGSGGSGITLAGNSITGNTGGSGIHVSATTALSLTGNTSSGNLWGLYFTTTPSLTLSGNDFSGNTYGPTVTNGGIATDSTWPLGLGTLFISGHASVGGGATLTVAPGLTVKFQNGNYLDVSGHLQAVGTSGSRIAFTGETASSGWWTGIRIEDGGSANLDYSDISYAGYSYWGDDPAIRKIGGGSLNVDHSTVSNCSREGIWIQDSAANHTIQNSILEASRTGLYLTSVSGTVTVSGNTIRNNSTQGIQIGSGGSGITLAGNSVSNNGGGSGIHVSATTALSLTGNTSSGNAWGFYFTTTPSLTLSGNDFSGNTFGPTLTNGGIATDSTWPASLGTLFISGHASVGGGTTLTVAPGLTIKFQNGNYLDVSGHLEAVGTSGSRIAFTGETASSGWWTGIRIEDGGSADLDYTDISYAGYAYWGDDPAIHKFGGGSLNVDHSTVSNSAREGIWIQDSGANHTIQNSTIESTRTGLYLTNVSGTVMASGNTIRNNSGQGIQVGNGGSGLTLTGNTITGNTGHAIYATGTDSLTIASSALKNNGGWGLYFEDTSLPTFAGNTISNNTAGRIGTGGGISRTVVWPLGISPLVVNGGMSVDSGATLNVRPGLVVKFSQNGYLVINGTLNSPGTSGLPIIFTDLRDDTGGDTNRDGSATSPAPGWWGGIRVENGGNATINYSTIRYGGGWPWNSANLTKTGAGSLNLSNSTISQSSYHGLVIEDSGDTQTITNNTFANNGYSGLALTNFSGIATIAGNTFSNNGDKGISLSSAGSGVTLSNNTIRDNGSQGVYLTNSTVSLTGNTISGNAHGGIYGYGGSVLTLTGNTITGNGDWGLYFDDSVIPSLAGNTISGNGTDTVGLGGSITRDLTWTAGDGPYLLNGGMVVASGATLTIQAGAVVKFNQNAYLVVNGSLHGAGTGGQPIYLTDSRDDTVGGDSNLDGSATIPAPGWWGGIRVENAGAATLGHTTIRYGGGWPWNYANLIKTGAGSITVVNSTLSHSASNGLVIENSGDSQSVSGSIFANNGYDGINLGSLSGILDLSNNSGHHNGSSGLTLGSFTGSATIAGNTFSNNGSHGISLGSIGAGTSLNNNTLQDNGQQGVYLNGATAVLTGNTISTNGHGGIYTYGGSLLTLTSNSVTGNGDWGLYFDDSAIPTLAGNTISGNGVDATGLGGNVNRDLTWTAADGPYVANGGMTVASGVTLTIPAGAVVKFSQSAYLVVNGNLHVAGTGGQPSWLTDYRDDSVGGDSNKDGNATSPAPGWWGGIRVENNGAATLSYCNLVYGGGWPWNYANLIKTGAGSITVANSTLSHSASNGLVIENSADSQSVSGSTFANNGYDGINLGSLSGILDLSTNSGHHNGSSGLTLGSFTGSATIAGNTFNNNGDKGISLSSIGAGTSLNNNTLRDNGQQGLYLNAATAVLTGNTISTNGHGGISGYGGSLLTLTSNTISGNGDWGLYFDDSAIPALAGNTISGNSSDATGLGGNINRNLTWSAADGPYVANGGMTVASGVTLTIPAGAVVKFNQNAYLVVNGSLNVAGTSGQPSWLTDSRDDSVGGDSNKDGSTTSPAQGWWGGIRVENNGTATLSYCTLRYGGGWPWSTANLAKIGAGSITVANSTISHSASHGLLIADSADSQSVSNSIFEYNAYDGINLSNLSGTVTLRSNIIRYNTGGGINLANSKGTVTRSMIYGNGYGIWITGARKPVIGGTAGNGNDIYSNANYALYTDGSAGIINAQYNYWGEAGGPPASGPNSVNGTFNTANFLTASIFDTTPPSGTVVINGGAVYTTSQTVTLTLPASDLETGVKSMCLSEVEPCPAENWQSYHAGQEWTFATADNETKHLYVLYRDYANHTMATSAQASIILDTVVPDVAINAAPADPTEATSGEFAFSSTDPSATFLCQNDRTLPAACTSPQGYGGISDDYALNFDGVDDSLTLPDGLIASTTTETIEMWFKTSSGGVLLGYQNAGLSNYVPALYVGLDGRLYGSLWPAHLGSQAPVNDGSWHHAALVGNVDAVYLYLDGVLQGAESAAIDHLDMSKNQLGVGNTIAWSTTPGGMYYFTGAIDEVRVWNLARSQEEILATIGSQLTGSEAGLVGYWNFDAGKGATVADLSGHGNTATLVNGPTFDDRHQFTVKAVDPAGNSSQASHAWTILPDTTITGQPAKPTKQTSATFTFTANKRAVRYNCRLDAGTFGACTSPKSYSGLAEGNHTFTVKAIDALERVDPTPAVFAWRVDLTAPDTTILSKPAALINQTSADFTFTSPDATATFECRKSNPAFDSGWGACISPRSFSDLAAGEHTFSVRAKDPAGNVDATPATWNWTIDLVVPNTSIITKPASQVNSTSGEFTFTSPDATVTFECRRTTATFDSGWVVCASPKTYSGLAAGAQTFSVRAKDPAGNIDATPATWSWSIDLIAPETSLTSKPAALVNTNSATFAFTSPDATATFECRRTSASFDSGWGVCVSPKSYSGLVAGTQSFSVRAKDPAGNIDATPATWDWSIDLTAPETSLTSHPAPVVNATTAAFAFNSPDPSATFECRRTTATFDSGWGGCVSPKSYSGLAAGAYSFTVRAKDAAGNIDGTPANCTWTIDRTAPLLHLSALADGAVTDCNVANLTGSATDGVGLATLTVNGAPVDPAGFSVAVVLADGANLIETVAEDLAGNRTSDQRQIVLDPLAPILDLATPADGSVVNSATLVVAGTVESGAAVSVKVNGGAFQGAPVTGTSFTKSVTLTSGENTLTVVATLGGATNTLKRTLILDVAAPALAVTAPPADLFTLTGAVTIQGVVSGAPAGAVVVVAVDGVEYTPAVSVGAFSQPLTLATRGTFPVVVTVRDSGGNPLAEVIRTIVYGAFTLTAAPAGPVATGTPVLFTAGLTGEAGGYEYKYALTEPGGVYHQVQAYGPLTTWTLVPTTAGLYKVVALVRPLGSTAPYEVLKTVGITVN